MNSMKRWFNVFVLAMGNLLAASGEDSFTNQLTALQVQVQADPTNTLLLFQLADLCHDAGANNDAQAVILAEGYFKRILAIDPNHAMARVLYGSVLTMKARDAFWPLTQLNYVKAGNREMDAAVKLAPQDAQVRFARAVNNFHMPSIMDREEIVKEDLAWLWPQAQLADTTLQVSQKQTIALFYGLTLQRRNKLKEAILVWRAGLALAPKSPEAARLTQQLSPHKARPK